MAYEKRNGDISIFPNDKATGKQPTHRGEFLLDGVTYEIALWEKESARGKFLAGSGKVKDGKYEKKEKPVADNSRNLNDGFDSEIPF